MIQNDKHIQAAGNFELMSIADLLKLALHARSMLPSRRLRRLRKAHIKRPRLSARAVVRRIKVRQSIFFYPSCQTTVVSALMYSAIATASVRQWTHPVVVKEWLQGGVRAALDRLPEIVKTMFRMAFQLC